MAASSLRSTLRKLSGSQKVLTGPLYTQHELGTNSAETFPGWAKAVWERSQRKLEALKRDRGGHFERRPAPTSSRAQDDQRYDASTGLSVVATIDLISDELCAVLDSASCCSSTHGDAVTRQVADKTFLELYEKVQTINLSSDLYCMLQKEHSERGRDADDDEVERVSVKLLQEFAWEGAGLASDQGRHRIGELQNQIRALSSKLEMDAVLLDSKRQPFHIHGVDIPNTEETFQQLLIHPELDASAKRDVYMQRFRLDPALESVAQSRQQLRALRHELATALGFGSFAQLQMQKNMVHRPEQVNEFLVRLADNVKPIVDRIVGVRPGQPRLNEWEIASHPRFTSKSQRVSRRVDSFFTIERCLAGLERVASEVFQVQMELQPSLSCSWGAQTRCWEMHIKEKNGTTNGILYLDLFAREGKSPGAAVYQIRTRRKHPDVGKDEQPSVALLSCTFPYSNPGNPSSIVVGHAGFRTLMHEFGHALHALLSRTRYQHLSGTRCEMDFMETPSLLLERMSWDARIVRLVDDKRFALDDADLKHIEQTRLGGFSALDIQEQALCGLFDLEVCGSSSRSENEIYWDVRRTYGSFAVPPNWKQIRKELYFFHINGTYAGSFYSYPWSNAIVASVWSELFEKQDPAKSGAGVLFRDELLCTGGSRDPFDVMQRLTGKREVNEEALIRDLQIK